MQAGPHIIFAIFILEPVIEKQPVKVPERYGQIVPSPPQANQPRAFLKALHLTIALGRFERAGSTFFVKEKTPLPMR